MLLSKHFLALKDVWDGQANAADPAVTQCNHENGNPISAWIPSPTATTTPPQHPPT